MNGVRRCMDETCFIRMHCECFKHVPVQGEDQTEYPTLREPDPQQEGDCNWFTPNKALLGDEPEMLKNNPKNFLGTSPSTFTKNTRRRQGKRGWNGA